MKGFRFISVFIYIVVFASCSSSVKNVSGISNILDGTSRTVDLSRSKLLIIKQRKMPEHYANFNYYTNYTPFIYELKTNLEAKGITSIQETLPVFDTATQEDIRAIAARHGADKILLIKEAYSIQSGLNIFSIGYLSIIGMYFFPGNNLKSFCDIKGTIIDAISGEELLKIEAKAKSHRYIYRIGNSQSVLISSITEAKNKALQIFTTKFLFGVKS